jgi:hypothetical protein
MLNFWKINSRMNQKINNWTVKIHCCQVQKTQKIQNNKYLYLFFQDCGYKDDLKILRITQLKANSSSEIQNQRTRSLREIHQQLDDFEQQNLFALMSCQPTSFKEAAKETHWVQAMNQEIDSIEKNKTWDLVDFPSHKKSIGVKWVYKTKLNEKGQIEKHKARLVAKGFSQQPGTDYSETFAPVARLDTVRTLLAIAAQHKWKVYQMDVKSTFLNGFLDEEVYVDHPPGFEV